MTPASLRAALGTVGSGAFRTPDAGGGTSAPDAVSPVAFPTGYVGRIYSADLNVIDAKGCANPAQLISFPLSAGCAGARNEIWVLVELPGGFDEIVADYGGNLMCFNIQGAHYTSGTNVLAWPCNNVVTANEQFRRPENTRDPSGGFYIVPAGNFNLTLNVKGGFGDRHNIVLFTQNNDANSEWFFLD